MKTARTEWVPGGMLRMAKRPSELASAPKLVPSMMTWAPERGAIVFASRTKPVTDARSWAVAGKAIAESRAMALI